MVRGSRGTRFTVPTLIRLLAQLAEADVPESNQAFTEGLSQWLGWTDAISLSAALDARPATTTGAAAGRPLSASAAEREFIRVRTGLVNAAAEDFAGPVDPEADLPTLLRRYTARQQAMESSIGALRRRLREALAGGSPSMVRLAAVDAVMDPVLGVQERALLSIVPPRLGKHFERLRAAHQVPPSQAPEAPDASDTGLRPAGWLGVFYKDMQAVLLAELELRLQPAEGLLEALRMSQPGRHE